jgi:hypothetical protein
MTIVGITMLWNDEDIAECNVRHMLAECDAVIATDNNSTDHTREILSGINDPRLYVRGEPDFAYCQPRVYNAMSDWAREELKADWIVPFDSDEWWYSTTGAIRDALSPDVPGYWVNAYTFRPHLSDDPAEPNPFCRCRWRSPDQTLFKVAHQARLGRAFNGAHGTSDSDTYPVSQTLFIRHLPYRSLEQAKRKLRHGKLALEAGLLPECIGSHWRIWGAMSDDAFEAWWRGWTDPSNNPIEDPLP